MSRRGDRDRWDRLQAKSLDQQFISEMREGLNCSPIEARAIAEKVHEIYGPLFEASAHPQPGQIQLVVVDASVAPNVPLSQATQKLVRLTLDERVRPIVKRVARVGWPCSDNTVWLALLAEEAFQQGGLLTLEDLSQLFNCGMRTLSADLQALRQQQIVPPLRSTVKDMGRALSHRRQIVEGWLRGQEYSEIALQSHHVVASVFNYVEKFKRCVALFREGFDIATTAFLVHLSPSLAREFHQIAEQAQPAAHRQKELDEFFKKSQRLEPLKPSTL